MNFGLTGLYVNGINVNVAACFALLYTRSYALLLPLESCSLLEGPTRTFR